MWTLTLLLGIKVFWIATPAFMPSSGLLVLVSLTLMPLVLGREMLLNYGYQLQHAWIQSHVWTWGHGLWGFSWSRYFPPLLTAPYDRIHHWPRGRPWVPHALLCFGVPFFLSYRAWDYRWHLPHQWDVKPWFEWLTQGLGTYPVLVPLALSLTGCLWWPMVLALERRQYWLCVR